MESKSMVYWICNVFLSYGNESPLNEDQARLTKKWQKKMEMHT